MDNAPNITPERFSLGTPLPQYKKGMSENKALYEERYEKFELSPQDADRIRGMGRDLNVLVIAEDWCGDVLRYLPVLERMTEAARGWDVRVFYRDQNPDLAGKWLKKGVHRAIPVIAFFDERMCELACFVEKPAAVSTADSQAREAFAARHPDLPDSHLHSSEMSPGTYALYVAFIQEHRAANLARWQQLFVDEILGLLDGVECEAA